MPRHFFLLATAAASYLCMSSALTSRRPHIVMIIVDDAGKNDVGYANDRILTPNIDALAAESVVFDSFYAYPTCSPSRSALFTGRWAHETSLTFALVGRAVGGANLTLPFLGEHLQRRGYRTELVGKWHCGHSKVAALPTARGFDRFFGLKGGGFGKPPSLPAPILKAPLRCLPYIVVANVDMCVDVCGVCCVWSHAPPITRRPLTHPRCSIPMHGAPNAWPYSCVMYSPMVSNEHTDSPQTTLRS
jgi:hypothetical protein